MTTKQIISVVKERMEATSSFACGHFMYTEDHTDGHIKFMVHPKDHLHILYDSMIQPLSEIARALGCSFWIQAEDDKPYIVIIKRK